MTTPALIDPTLRTPQQAAHDIAQARRRAGDITGAALIMEFLHHTLKIQDKHAGMRIRESK